MTTEDADQLVFEYLGQVAEIAHHHLNSSERVNFVSRLRTRIEEYRAKAGGATTPEQVRKVLNQFGDPERLVLRERRRLDAAVNGEPDGERRSGEAAAGSLAGPSAGPAPPGRAPGGNARSRQGRGVERSPRRFGDTRRVTRTVRTEAAIRRATPRSAAAPGARTAPRLTTDENGRVELNRLIRARRLEVGSVLLLGVGGLLLPIPLWLFGAAIATLSRGWTERDKLIGVLGPLVATAVGVFAHGSATSREDQALDVAAFMQSFTDLAPTILRLAGLVGALYLGWRLLRSGGARGVRMSGRT